MDTRTDISTYRKNQPRGPILWKGMERKKMSCVIYQVSCVISHMSFVMCHVLPVTLHFSPVTKTNSHRPFLLTRSLCTVGWFAKTKWAKKESSKQKPSTAKTQKPSRGIKILEMYSSTRSLKLKPIGHIQRLGTMGTIRTANIANSRLNRPRGH